MILLSCTLALAATATFDAPQEGQTASSVTEDGITVGPLDDRLSPTGGTLTIERAVADLTGTPGFTAPNVLGFGGYVPGDGTAFGRFGSLAISGPSGSDSAQVEVWELGNGALPLRLEAIEGGAVVASAEVQLGGWAVTHHTLVIEATPFDSLRLVAVGGPTDAAFLVVDTIVITTSGDPTEPPDTDVPADTSAPVDSADRPDPEVVDTATKLRDTDEDEPDLTDDDPTDPAPSGEEGGCGCAAPGSGAGWALAPWVALFALRRRRVR